MLECRFFDLQVCKPRFSRVLCRMGMVSLTLEPSFNNLFLGGGGSAGCRRGVGGGSAGGGGGGATS